MPNTSPRKSSTNVWRNFGSSWATARPRSDGRSCRPGDTYGVAAVGDDRIAPRVQQIEQALRVRAERSHEAALHPIRCVVDPLAKVPTGVGQVVSLEQTSRAQTITRCVELVIGPTA